jgi:hypothetical protein
VASSAVDYVRRKDYKRLGRLYNNIARRFSNSILFIYSVKGGIIIPFPSI